MRFEPWRRMCVCVYVRPGVCVCMRACVRACECGYNVSHEQTLCPKLLHGVRRQVRCSHEAWRLVRGRRTKVQHRVEEGDARGRYLRERRRPDSGRSGLCSGAFAWRTRSLSLALLRLLSRTRGSEMMTAYEDCVCAAAHVVCVCGALLILSISTGMRATGYGPSGVEPETVFAAK